MFYKNKTLLFLLLSFLKMSVLFSMEDYFIENNQDSYLDLSLNYYPFYIDDESSAIDLQNESPNCNGSQFLDQPKIGNRLEKKAPLEDEEKKDEQIKIIEQSGCLYPKLTDCACGKKFKNYCQLIKHAKKFHKKTKETDCCTKTFYICPACEITPTSNLHQMCSHYKKHTKQVCRHICPLCGTRHPSPTSLKHHFKKHHNLKVSLRNSVALIKNFENNSAAASAIKPMELTDNNKLVLGLRLNIADLLNSQNK